MIHYENENQWRLIFMLKGSVLPRALPVGVMGFLMGSGLAFIRYQGYPAEYGIDPQYVTTNFTINLVGVTIGYLLVMRTNMGLRRWMDAITSVEVMLSKWADAYNTMNTFFAGQEGDIETLKRIQHYRVQIAHWFCLMSCIAFASLRDCTRDGSHEINLEDIPILPKFPVGSQKVTFRKLKAGMGGSSTPDSEHEHLMKLDLTVFHAPTEEEVQILDDTSDKVNIIMLWIIQGLTLNIRDKVLDAPPPLITRVYQEISQGMMGYHQAVKVAIVPFPFPFAQLVSIFLMLMCLLVPLFIDVFTKNVLFTPVLSSFIPMILVGLNVLAVELETPFSIASNCIDIEPFHEEFFHMLEDTLLTPMMPPETTSTKLEVDVLEGVAARNGEEYVHAIPVNDAPEEASGSEAEEEAHLRECLQNEKNPEKPI